jgi:Amt family ammonium transporter
MDFEGIGRIATNTTLAACAAGLGAMFYAYPKTKTWDVSFTVNGFLAGLVAITCPCYWVSPTGAILLGGIAGVIVVMGVDLLEYLRIDDPIGAVPVHGICGIWVRCRSRCSLPGSSGRRGRWERTIRRH